MKSTFQIVIMAVSLIAFVVAIAAFSGLFSSGSSSSQTVGPNGYVTMWGTVPYEQVNKYLTDFNSAKNGYTVQYEEHSIGAFYGDLIKALANNTQPDMVLFPSELLAQVQPRLYTVPFAAYNERTFRDTNVDGAQIFIHDDGIVAMPIVVDPMVVYYNKDILAAHNLVTPPLSWDFVQNLAPIFLRRGVQDSSIKQSEVAMGGFDNIAHASDILSTLFLQTGNPLMVRNRQTGFYDSTLSQAKDGDNSVDILATSEALAYYTSFSNPLSKNYSWNTSLGNSFQQFLAGSTAFYFGRASELFAIQSQNPNLNFDVARMFQPEKTVRPITYGSFISLGVLKNAPNFITAYAAMTALSTPEAVDAISKTVSLPPARRDLLAIVPSDPYVSVFFKSALASFAWPNPNISATDGVFRTMVNSVVSGTFDANAAIQAASRDLQTAAAQQ